MHTHALQDDFDGEFGRGPTMWKVTLSTTPARNGFCVLRVKARGQRDAITVIGHAAMISAGEFVQASGTWGNDRTPRVQFSSFLKATAPTTVEGIEKISAPE
jgi:hypothetical protein